MSYSDTFETAARYAKQLETLHEVEDAIVGHPSTKHYSGSFTVPFPTVNPTVRFSRAVALRAIREEIKRYEGLLAETKKKLKL